MSSHWILPDGRKITRRKFLAGATAAGTLIVIGGCAGSNAFGGGGNQGGGGGGLTLRNRTLAMNFNTIPVAVDGGKKVNYSASFSDNGIQGAYWGPQNADGTAADFFEALIWDASADSGARMHLDARGLPSMVMREDNGAFITCFWDEARAVIKFFQASGSYIGGCQISGSAGNFSISQLHDSKVVGLYVGTLDNTFQGVFSLALGGLSQPSKVKRQPRLTSRPLAATGVSPAMVKNGLTRIGLVLANTQYPAFAKALLNQLASEYLTTGASPTFTNIAQQSLANTALTGLFQDGGLSIVRALSANAALTAIAKTMLASINSGGDPVKQGVLTFPQTGPGITDYVVTSALPSPLGPSDKTGVTGAMVSRDFGSVPVAGVIDATGKFSVTGSSNGMQFTMEGTAVGTKVSGQWSRVTATRQNGGSGGFNGQQQQLGQCSQQQLSGGEGVYTNTYDLGKCGEFPFQYQAYVIPDEFIVLNNGQLLVDTGSVSGGTTLNLFVSGASTLVIVIVVASLQGTAWNYTIGCPS